VRAKRRKYVVDTNLFIDAFVDPAAMIALQAFHGVFAPFEYLSAVVVSELRAGARTRAAREAIESAVVAPFERRRRLVTPSYAAWGAAGDALATLGNTEGLVPKQVPRSFGNDLLLAASCREAGLTIVTRNRRDFARIARVIPVDFVDPWPSA
jgi:predicted nucleic acid-binding protein